MTTALAAPILTCARPTSAWRASACPTRPWSAYQRLTTATPHRCAIPLRARATLRRSWTARCALRPRWMRTHWTLAARTCARPACACVTTAACASAVTERWTRARSATTPSLRSLSAALTSAPGARAATDRSTWANSATLRSPRSCSAATLSARAACAVTVCWTLARRATPCSPDRTTSAAWRTARRAWRLLALPATVWPSARPWLVWLWPLPWRPSWP
eukprot:Mycagemm_TRINITY_DN10242_c0_g2::TRINITY_DN10242_c0_g2_i1::g.4152::m.4152 type:complete len:219 gc:universal TRINITY_DN10242_c0_g2_i1:897-241(-)